jgi:hypothetical protein
VRAERARRVHRGGRDPAAEQFVQADGAADGDRGAGPTAGGSVETAVITNIRIAVS